MTRLAPGNLMLGISPRRIASRKLLSQSGTCRDSSAKSMNLGGEALWFGGSAGAAPVFSAGPAVVFVCIAHFLSHAAGIIPWPVVGRSGRTYAMGERVTALPLTARKRLLNQAKAGIVKGVRNRVTRVDPLESAGLITTSRQPSYPMRCRHRIPFEPWQSIGR